MNDLSPRTLFGTAIRTLVTGLAVAVMVVIVALTVPASKPIPAPARSQTSATIAKANPEVSSVQPSSESSSVSDSPVASEGVANRDDAMPKPVALDSTVVVPNSLALPALLETIEDGIVKIETGTGDGDSGNNHGSGFVIDAQGLIATNYHVLADATTARARFKNGVSYEIEGYVAVEPEHDLAIVKLRAPHAPLTPLPLARSEDPPRLSFVLAIGHPQGVDFSPFDGKISRVLNTSELPGRSQQFLRRYIAGRLDHRWIQHTASIAEGNSGGPLLNDEGEVIGVNTWTDREARFGYALHVRHLRDLQAELSDHIAPLSQFAQQDTRTAEFLRGLTVERLDQLFAESQAMDWRPVSEEQYETLQRLAWAVTAIGLPRIFSNGKLEERLPELKGAAERIVEKLSRQRWDAFGHFTLINEHAQSQAVRRLAGLFFFATLERTVEGENAARGALLKLAGTEQTVFVPLDDNLTVPAPGTTCLVLGINYDGRSVRYGDNPLRLIVAPVVATRTIVPLKP